MSGQLRTIKNRIRSVENTKKITHAMEMVAAAKLRRFQDMMVKARPFTEGLEELLHRLLRDQLAQASRTKKRGKKESLLLHPFFETREEKRIAVVFMTSDAGLCGSYNTDLIQLARRFFTEHQNKKATTVGVGKFGISALKRMGLPLHSSFQDIRASRVEEVLTELTSTLEKLYLAKEVDAIYVIYSHFMTLSTYKGIATKLLPFKAPAELVEKGEETQTSDYIYEPSPELIFKKLVPLYFESKIRMMFLESFVSEQIARMTAMRQATDNAKEMIESLTLQRNKARQASITKELIEIVSGSRAQKNK